MMATEPDKYEVERIAEVGVLLRLDVLLDILTSTLTVVSMEPFHATRPKPPLCGP